jgi:hypothetical protein
MHCAWADLSSDLAADANNTSGNNSNSSNSSNSTPNQDQASVLLPCLVLKCQLLQNAGGKPSMTSSANLVATGTTLFESFIARPGPA